MVYSPNKYRETEGIKVRRLGYDLSVARLQQEALNLGITKSVSAMTQAEKAELRYYAIMTQVTVAQGDMARTLNAPANQLRVLKAQLNQAARAIGNIFIPALNAILPYAIAAVKGIRMVAEAIASLFGYELPEIDYSSAVSQIEDLGTGVGDVSDGLGDAGNNAKKLKDYLLGIDELNVISPDTDTGSGSSGGSGSGGTGGSGLDFELPTYDFLGNAVTSRIDEAFKKLKPYFEWVKEHLDLIKEVTLAIGAGLLAWKIADGIADFFEKTLSWKQKVGIAMMATGVVLGWEAGYDIGYEGLTWENVLKSAIADALIIFGSVLTFGATPIGWGVGIGLAIAVTATAILAGLNARKFKEECDKRFGELHLDDETIEWLVNVQLNDGWYDGVKTALSAYDDLKKAREDLADNKKNLISWQVKLKYSSSISESEAEALLNDAITTIDSINTALDEKEKTVRIMLETTFGGDDENEDFIQSIIDRSTSIDTTFRDTLTSLGEELSAIVNSGFNDSLFEMDTHARASEIIRQIAEINRIVAESQTAASIKVFELTWSDVDKESWDTYLSQLGTMSAEMTANVQKLYQEQLLTLFYDDFTNIDIQLDQGEITQEEYDKLKAEIEEQLNYYLEENPLQLKLNEVNLLVGELIGKGFRDTLGDVLDEAFVGYDGLKIDIDWNSQQSIDDAWTVLVGKNSEQLALMNDFLNKSQTALTSFFTAAVDTVKSGGQLTAEQIQSTTDTMYMAWLNGWENFAGINVDDYMFGFNIQDSPDFLKQLTEIEGVGASFSDSFILGLQTAGISFTEEGGIISMILNGKTIGSVTSNQTILDNLKSLGYELGGEVTETVAEAIESTDTTAVGTALNNSISGATKSIGGSSTAVQSFYSRFSTISSNGFKSLLSALSQSKISTAFQQVMKDARSGLVGNSAVTNFNNRTAQIGKNSFNNITNPVSYAALNKAMTNGISGASAALLTNSSAVTMATNRMSSFASSVKSKFSSINSQSEYYNDGYYSAFGFKEGISYYEYITVIAIRNMANNIIAAFRSKLGIHSPSTVFWGFGGNTVGGYTNGVYDNIPNSVAAMNEWSDELEDAFNPKFTQVDAEQIMKAYDVDRVTAGVSASVTTAAKATVTAEGFEAALEKFYETKMKPTLDRIANDTERQADKPESTIVKVDGKTLFSTVENQKRKQGYSFSNA